MKNPKSLDILLVYTVISLIFVALVYPKMAMATETDPYTYSYVKLNDSAPQINAVINDLFGSIFDEVNLYLSQHPQTSDTYIEWYFSYLYYKKAFKGNIVDDSFSYFEGCIDSNKCKDWPYIERIMLYPGESIYAEADYTKLSKKYVAATIQLCGVRLGTDKLTHFFKDGFELYNGSKDSDYRLTAEDFVKYSAFYEKTIMGSYTTGVFSNADIRANIKGAQFFTDLFNKNLVRRKDGSVAFKPVDICNYVDRYFDERIMKNVYTESPEKVARLEAVIKKRLNDKSEPFTREQILSRKSDNDQPTMFEAAAGNLGLSISKWFNPFQRMALDLTEKEPIYQTRLPTKIPKEKE